MRFFFRKEMQFGRVRGGGLGALLEDRRIQSAVGLHAAVGPIAATLSFVFHCDRQIFREEQLSEHIVRVSTVHESKLHSFNVCRHILHLDRFNP
jgi:hypothetical protein